MAHQQENKRIYVQLYLTQDEYTTLRKWALDHRTSVAKEMTEHAKVLLENIEQDQRRQEIYEENDQTS